MLQKSTDFVEKASKAAMDAAEAMAKAMMCSDFMQDLISAERALEIAEEHRLAVSEEWKREVHSALIGLTVLKKRGKLSGIE
jgi:hypothetical protein